MAVGREMWTNSRFLKQGSSKDVDTGTKTNKDTNQQFGSVEVTVDSEFQVLL